MKVPCAPWTTSASEMGRGRVLGVVGESGCGKSVLARSIMRIVRPPGRTVEGEVLYSRPAEDRPAGTTDDVVELCSLDQNGPEMRRIRGADITMVFQEPMVSFGPVHTIGEQIVESILLHQDVTKKDARDRAIEVLEKVGIPSPERVVDEYPFRLSGGMRQRAMIAMALSCNPKLLIADEPTTALDVTTQAQILELMAELQAESGMAMVLITHNLGVVAPDGGGGDRHVPGEGGGAGRRQDSVWRPEAPLHPGAAPVDPQIEAHKTARPPGRHPR